MKWPGSLVLPLAFTALGHARIPAENQTAGFCDTKFGNNNLCGQYGNDEDSFLPYNVYYNGTMTFAYQPSTDASHWTYNCVANTNETVPQSAFLCIGDMLTPDGKHNRSNWDANPYWFSLGGCKYSPSWFDSEAAGYRCPKEEGSSAQFQSSSSKHYWGQAWALQASRSGDGYDISGHVTTTKDMGINQFTFSLDCKNTVSSSISFINTGHVLTTDAASMTGHMLPTAATLTVTLHNASVNGRIFDGGSLLSYTFSGSWWVDGAKLVDNGVTPEAEGAASTAQDISRTLKDSRLKSIPLWAWIVIIVVVVVAITGLLLTCCYFGRYRKAMVAYREPPMQLHHQRQTRPPLRYSQWAAKTGPRYPKGAVYRPS